ncbi:hypothetical protein ACJIZ3_008322 [Penstemon smallii]|uniref:Ribosome maturation factor RimM n=1 Tax=Penstemon smallii TaxID=265156 RepID=A0ABD3T9E2_9LAMI
MLIFNISISVENSFFFSSSSILCSCSNYLSPSLYFSPYIQFIALHSRKQHHISFSFSSKLPSTPFHKNSPSRSPLHSTATQELVETSTSSAPRFIETGYIFGVHGFQGEVRVKPTTDFPDLRFSKPGTRWLKQQVSGTETLEEIELVEGRGHPGQSWLVRFNNIDSMEQAQKLVGSTILVRDEDRPVLEEGEFYTHDLIGMTVILKESGEPVGSVVSVFNSGASDLLHVKLKSKQGGGDSGPLIYVPFVEAIVPTVDLEKREMLITPPKGLLELNIRADERSKKERREIEWKERKKFQRRLIAAKKKLCEMEQQHVFDGFRHGEKEQTRLLANQIVTLNSKLLQQALPYIETPCARHNLVQILSAVPRSNTLKVSDNPISDQYHKLQRAGHLLTSNGKAAIILVLQEIENIEKSSDTNLVDSEGNENTCRLVKAFLDDHQRLVKIEDRSSVPVVLICSAHSVSSLQEFFSVHDYFGFNSEKVWFLEEEKLPVVNSSLEGHTKNKVLMKSPWEFLQKPIGSGGVISLLSSHNLLDKLNEMGVEYIEICNVHKKHEHGLTLLGLVDSCKANVGIQLFKDGTYEEDFDVILTMSFMKKLVNQINKLKFHAVLASNSYAEKVDKEWVNVVPSASNSYEFRCSIYSSLDVSPINRVCVLDST